MAASGEQLSGTRSGRSAAAPSAKVVRSAGTRSTPADSGRLRAPEPDIGAAAVNGAPSPTADVVTRAVLIAAQERSAFLHALGDARLLRIHAVARAARIARDALGVELREIVGTIPVGTPLPDISADIV